MNNKNGSKFSGIYFIIVIVAGCLFIERVHNQWSETSIILNIAYILLGICMLSDLLVYYNITLEKHQQLQLILKTCTLDETKKELNNFPFITLRDYISSLIKNNYTIILFVAISLLSEENISAENTEFIGKVSVLIICLLLYTVYFIFFVCAQNSYILFDSCKNKRIKELLDLKQCASVDYKTEGIKISEGTLYKIHGKKMYGTGKFLNRSELCAEENSIITIYKTEKLLDWFRGYSFDIDLKRPSQPDQNFYQRIDFKNKQERIGSEYEYSLDNKQTWFSGHEYFTPFESENTVTTIYVRKKAIENVSFASESIEIDNSCNDYNLDIEENNGANLPEETNDDLIEDTNDSKSSDFQQTENQSSECIVESEPNRTAKL